MRIIFRDAEGVKHWRTLTRLNVRKVAHSVHKVYRGTIPLGHIIGAIENALNFNFSDTVEFRLTVGITAYQKPWGQDEVPK